jgi:ATP-dependent protease HslVU (ClpYQ) peptidase subunit
MTVVAWDGKTLAADKRALAGGLISTVTKIRKIGKLLCGVAGAFTSGQELLAWVELGRKPDDFPVEIFDDDELYADLLIIEAGKILKYERSPIPILLEDKIYAIGSGSPFALAAMYCGKTAEEAIAVAASFDAGCGNGVDTLTLSKK